MLDVEIARFVLARIPRTASGNDVKETYDALLAAEQIGSAYPFTELVGPVTVEATLYRVARDLRILARVVDGDDTDAVDEHDALVRAAETIEACAELTRFHDVAIRVTLDLAAHEAREAEAAQ